MSSKTKTLLENLYYNVENPEAYTGVQPLLKKASSKHVPQSAVREWLQTQDTYTLFKPARKRFPRNKYVVTNINDLWQADLVDMQKLKRYNDGVNYLLTVIDVFSKKAYVQPIKNKTGSEVIKAFEKIFKETKGTTPYKLQTDKGKEFVASNIGNFFDSLGIRHFTTSNPDVKASVVERFNRTLKTRMYRYLFRRNSCRYLDELPHMVEGYNNSYHRSIKMSPNSVNDGNILKVYQNLYGNFNDDDDGTSLPAQLSSRSKNKRKPSPRYVVGDYVRLSKSKKHFAKGYEMSFTEEIFKIIKVIRHPCTVYMVEDLNGEIIEGKFYEQELQKVSYNPDAEFVVEEVIKTKGRGEKAQYFVKWRGYPMSFNSWIPATELKNVHRQ